MCRVREPPHPLKHGWEGLLRAESWHPSSGARKAEETPRHPHNSPFPEKQAFRLCQLCSEETSLSFVHLYEVPTHAPLKGPSVYCSFVFRPMQVSQASYLQRCPKDPLLRWLMRSYSSFHARWRKKHISPRVLIHASFIPLPTTVPHSGNSTQTGNQRNPVVQRSEAYSTFKAFKFERKKRTKIGPNNPKPNLPTNTSSVAILSISFLRFTWHDSSVKTQVTPKLRNQLREILIT